MTTDPEWTMRSKGSAEALTQQIGEFRDRAADMIASDGGSRDASKWPGRLLWFGLGMGIGAAAAGGRLLNALPTQLASRLDDVANKVTAAVETGQSELAGSFAGDTSEPVWESTSPSDKTIDVTERASEAVTEGLGATPAGAVGSR